jgi:2-phospho-L-lactate guanylyltransferase
MSLDAPTDGFTVVMPMKPWDRAKSRLHVEPAARRTLAEAFARDTLAAVLDCPEVHEVVVVTRGDLVVEQVRGAGAQVIQEPLEQRATFEAFGRFPTPRTCQTLQNLAIREGIAWAAEHRPCAPVAIVPSDLPAMTSDALGRLLREAATHAFAFVADANGDGTTILTARTPDLMHAGYGSGSAERHRAYGAHELTDAEAVLRQDVDVLDDLAAADRLGLGAHTRRTYADLTVAPSAVSR